MVAGSAVLVRALHVDSLATVIAVNLLAGGGAGVAAIALSKRSALVAVLFEVRHRWIAPRRTSSRERLS
jgi:hypothetical protein